MKFTINADRIAVEAETEFESEFLEDYWNNKEAQHPSLLTDTETKLNRLVYMNQGK